MASPFWNHELERCLGHLPDLVQFEVYIKKGSVRFQYAFDDAQKYLDTVPFYVLSGRLLSINDNRAGFPSVVDRLHRFGKSEKDISKNERDFDV